MQCQRYDVAVELDKKKTVNDKLSFLSIFSWLILHPPYWRDYII